MNKKIQALGHANVIFAPRVPELRRLEGWHDIGNGMQIKISCRYRDILRCSDFNGKTKHFTSCFRRESQDLWDNGGAHSVQPLLRCIDPTWAIAYLPDKHGNFQARAFVRLLKNSLKGDDNATGTLEIGRVFGNGVSQNEIRQLFENIIKMNRLNLNCQCCSTDTYL